MKLMEFNSSTSKYRPSGSSLIRIDSKSGVLQLSANAARRIGLEDNSYIVVCQDLDRPQDWYIKKTDDQNGFKLRGTKSGSVMFNNAYIARKILQSAGITKQSATMLVGNAIELYNEALFGIITSSVKNEAK